MATPAARLLQVEIWLAVLIPSRLGLPVLGGAGWPAMLFGIGILLLWAFSVLNGDPALRPCRPVRVVLSIFWACLLGGYALMHAHAIPGIESRNADRYLMLLMALSGVALTAAEGLRDRDDVLAVLRAQVAAVTVMTVVAFLQFRLALDLTVYLQRIPLLSANGAIGGIHSRNGFGRPAGTANHPIEFGVVVVLTIGPAIFLWLHDHVRPRPRRFAQFFIVAMGVPISISRSALLGTAIVVMALLVVMPLRRRLWSLASVVGLCTIVFLLVPGLLGTLRTSIFAGQSDSSIATRTSDYAVVARYVRPHLWFGRGPGTFLPSVRILDNQYLVTLIEQGLVGLAALLMLYGAALFLGRGARRLARTQDAHELGQLVAASGLTMVIIGATFDAMSFFLYTMFCGLALGLAGAVYRIAVEGAPPDGLEEPQPHRKPQPLVEEQGVHHAVHTG